MRSWHRPMQGPAHDIDCRTRRGNWPMPATAHGHGGPIQRYGRQGYKGVAVLGFNPNPPLPFSLVCVAALDLAFSTMCFGLDPCHLSHSSPRRRGLPTPLLTTPLHCLPHPCSRSMWHSRPMWEFPSSRSATWAARVRNMCELVEDTAPMGLSSGGGMVFACCSGGCGGGVMETVDCGGGGSVRTAPPRGGGGGGGHTSDPILGEIRSVSLTPIYDARVPVGQPLGLIRIRAICLYADLLGGDSGTGMTLINSSPSSSSASAMRPRPHLRQWQPLLLPPSDSVMTTPNSLVQPGKGTSSNCGWHKEFPDDLLERWPGLRVLGRWFGGSG
jgi:hypothetical protein